MVALVACFLNPVINASYGHLPNAGKVPKIALVGVSRKLIAIVNAMVRDNRARTPPASPAQRLRDADSRQPPNHPDN